MSDSNDSIEAKTPFGTLVAHGATVVLIVLMLSIGFFLVRLGEQLVSHNAAMLMAEAQNIETRKQIKDSIDRQASVTEFQTILLRAICYRLSDNKDQALRCEGYTMPEEEMKYYDRKKGGR